MNLQLKTLHADFGVEISGCDLSKPLDDKDFQAIRDAFFHHSVVVIRDQNLTAEAQCAFLRRFGTPKIAQRKEFQVPGVPEIGRLGNTKNPDGTPSAFLDRHGNLWHSRYGKRRAEPDSGRDHALLRQDPRARRRHHVREQRKCNQVTACRRKSHDPKPHGRAQFQ